MYDSRDNAANTYTGRYALLTYKFNPEFLGSDQSSSTLWLEYRDYFNWLKSKPQNIIAIWVYGNFQTSGNLPYMNLPALGWDQFGRSGRAYTQGRFRGQDVVYTEAEFRVHLLGASFNPDFFGAVAFLNATPATNKDADIGLFDYINLCGGFGLRFMLDKTSRTNLTLDYAWGAYEAKGLYLNMNETF